MGKLDLSNTNEEYFDALKELGNIGAGNATSALAQLLGQRVEVKVPKVNILEFREVGSAIGGEDEVMAGVCLLLEGDVTGSMMFLQRKQGAKQMAGKLLGKPNTGGEGDLDEMEASALKEIGNIITSAYLNSISLLTSLAIYPSVPELCVDMAGAILSVPATQFGMMCDKLLLIETVFSTGTEGYLILVPDIGSYERILNSLGM